MLLLRVHFLRLGDRLLTGGVFQLQSQAALQGCLPGESLPTGRLVFKNVEIDHSRADMKGSCDSDALTRAFDRMKKLQNSRN